MCLCLCLCLCLEGECGFNLCGGMGGRDKGRVKTETVDISCFADSIQQTYWITILVGFGGQE